MKNNLLFTCVGGLLLAPFCLSSLVRAQLSKQDHEAAERMVSGTLYLRLQAPQKYGVGGWSTYSESMLEASPTRVSADRKLAEPLKPLGRNGYHLKNEEVYWGFLANTAVSHCRLVTERGILVVWCERADHNDLSVDIIDINSLDDFTKAFSLAFSKVPMQDEHPEWPTDVREGIASGKLVVGMTPEQARIVTGAPLSITAGEENGAKTETWMLRQDAGEILGWNTRRGAHMGVARQTGLPVSITFKDRRLLPIK